VEIGTMNPGRWQRIAETLVSLGMASSMTRLQGFVYDPESRWDPVLIRFLVWLGLGTLLSTCLVALWNLQMRRSVRERTRELQASEERFRQITDHIDEVFWLTDPSTGEMIYVSPAYETIWGRSCESLHASPRQWLEAAHPEDRDRLEKAADTRQTDGTYNEEYRIVRPDGSVRWIRDRAFPVHNASGELHRIVGVAQDITLQKQTQEALRHSEEKFSTAFQSSPDGLVLARISDGVLVEVNEVFVRISGYSREQALGRTTVELGLWADPADRGKYLSALKRDGLVREQPFSFRGVSGVVRDGLVSGEVIQLGGEALALTTIRDVTEINKIQQRLVSIYDTVGDVIFLITVEGDGGYRFESVNKRFAATTGLPAEAVIGKRVEEVIPHGSLPLVLGRYREAIESKTVVRWEETSDYPTGRRTGDVSIAPIFDQAGRCTHLVGAVHDVTERKAAEERHQRAEEMLRQSQKLEGIGRLAGGIAHDFNNILGVILGYSELMERQIGEDHVARPRLEQVIQAAQRAAGLTRQLLAFSRKQVMQPKLLDLGSAVNDMRRMLERVVGEDLEIEVRSGEGLGAVLADPTQIEQVVMNLVVNARDAMPTGGHLTIETANADLDESYAATHPPAQPGRFVMLAVSDTGVGMDVETQQRMFEPFFTTKPAGEGPGLGLATVYGIVKQMGGYVWVYSEVGHGTTFKTYLPRVPDTVAAPTEPAAARPLPRGDETVLVVEDSASLREMILELLGAQGYTVLSAEDGEVAVALAREPMQKIDLMLTDVVMPKLGGADLMRQVRALRPEIRVLYMSGYTAGAISKHGVLQQGSSLLEKPFTSEQLARAVRRALDAEGSPTGDVLRSK
jgi:PAS domain S-box-containing protein